MTAPDKDAAIRAMMKALAGARDVVETAIDEWGHDGDVKLLARIDAALALAKSVLDAGEWQPIETAPKDGTTIIVYRPPGNEYCPLVGEDYWRAPRGGQPAWQKSNVACLPTRWQPLPAPPADQAVKP